MRRFLILCVVSLMAFGCATPPPAARPDASVVWIAPEAVGFGPVTSGVRYPRTVIIKARAGEPAFSAASPPSSTDPRVTVEPVRPATDTPDGRLQLQLVLAAGPPFGELKGSVHVALTHPVVHSLDIPFTAVVRSPPSPAP